MHAGMQACRHAHTHTEVRLTKSMQQARDRVDRLLGEREFRAARLRKRHLDTVALTARIQDNEAAARLKREGGADVPNDRAERLYVISSLQGLGRMKQTNV